MTKSDFRIQCLQQQRALGAVGKNYRDARINTTLLHKLGDVKGKHILLYWPFGFEADIRRTIYKLRHKNSLYLPRVTGESFEIVPFRLPLRKTVLGIWEPRVSRFKSRALDIAIVPVIGVDGSGARVGFGKGMYDRFFPTLKSKPLTIFVQSRRCVTSLELCDQHDIKGAFLVSSKGLETL